MPVFYVLQDKAAMLANMEPDAVARLLACMDPNEAVLLLSALGDGTSKLVSNHLSLEDRDRLVEVCCAALRERTKHSPLCLNTASDLAVLSVNNLKNPVIIAAGRATSLFLAQHKCSDLLASAAQTAARYLLWDH